MIACWGPLRASGVGVKDVRVKGIAVWRDDAAAGDRCGRWVGTVTAPGREDVRWDVVAGRVVVGAGWGVREG